VKLTSECRASAGICDIADVCDGVADSCPANAFEPVTTECRVSAGVCDAADFCDGASAPCTADVKLTNVCRASAGICDIADVCDGVANSCPADAFEPATSECRASAGVCDTADFCDGAGALCTADLKLTSECRAVAGICDVAEACDGVSNTCPFDEMTPFGEECGSLDFGDWAEDVELNEGNAYVAVLQDGLQIVRLMATGPEIVGAYDPPSCEDGSGMDELWAEDVELDPSRGLAYLAAGPCGMLIVNVEDPTNPFLEGSFDTLGWTEDVEAMGDGYVLLADFNGGLLVVDIFDPEAPLEVGRIGFIDPSFGGAIDVDVLGSMAYVSTTGGLRIVDVSDPENPTLVGSYDTDPLTGFGEDAEAVEVEFETSVGTFVFLSTWMDGVEIIDVTDPAEPVSVQVIPTTNEETSASLEVTVAGTIAFIADGLDFLRIFDVSNPDVFLTSDPADPIEKPLFQTLGYAWDVEVEDEIAYVAVGIDPFGARTGKLQIVHVSDMGIPLNATSMPIPEPGRDVMLAFGVAMLSALAWRSRWKRGRVD
jgi:hypothetical protein